MEEEGVETKMGKEEFCVGGFVVVPCLLVQRRRAMGGLCKSVLALE